jgi:hypothetical protein
VYEDRMREVRKGGGVISLAIVAKIRAHIDLVRAVRPFRDAIRRALQRRREVHAEARRKLLEEIRADLPIEVQFVNYFERLGLDPRGER